MAWFYYALYWARANPIKAAVIGVALVLVVTAAYRLANGIPLIG